MELSREIATPTFFSQRVWLIAILIALLHAAMAVTAVNTKSPTFDEPQHLTAGYSYWVTNDFRLDPENGNLPARWAALPLLLSHPNFVPLNDRGWQRAEEGRTGHQFFYEVGNDPDRTLGQARMMMSIFGAALCLLMYRCGGEFFGVGGGLLAATVFFAIWLSFSFRYSAWTNNESSHEKTTWHWNYLLEDSGTFESAVRFARAHRLLPEAYLYGFAYVHKHEIDRPAFLDNQWSVVGFRSFFPRAFIYKTPLPFLLLVALAFYAALARRHSSRISNLNPLAMFALIYGAIAITSHLNIGHRHLLPVYPALFIGCGAIVHLARENRTAILTTTVGIILFWQIGESFAIRPNYLAYFNEVAGGPSNGYKHLADSSVDWGQDLPALKTWLDNHPAIVNRKPLYLAYFGTADPRSYEINARLLPENHSSGDRAFAPLTGGIYCISATTLQSVYAREIGQWCVAYEQYYQAAAAEIRRYYDTASDPTRRVAMIANDGALNWAKKIKDFERLRFERLCAYLRHQAPAAQIGYSVFVFELTDDAVNRALYGPPAELTRDVCVSGF